MPSRGNDDRSTGYLALSLCALLFVAPLFWGSTDRWIWLLLSAFCFLLVLIYPRSVISLGQISGPLKMILPVFFFFLVLQTFFFAQNKYEARLHFMLWMALAAVFFLIQLLPREDALRLFSWMAVIGFLEALYAIYQSLSGSHYVLWREKIFHLENATGTYMNRNHCANMLAMCMNVQLGVWHHAWKSHKPAKSFVIGAIMAATGTALYLTGSRMGMVSALISLMFYLVFILFQDPKHRPGALFIAGLVFVFSGLTWMVLKMRFGEVHASLLFADGGRLEAWKGSIPLIRDYLWQGVGLGNFDWVYPRYQPATLFSRWQHAHNDYLELLAELGLPLFLMFLGLLIYGLKALIAELRRSGQSYPIARILSGFTALACFLIHGLTDFNWAIPANCFIAAALFGLIWRLIQPLRTESAAEVQK
ncbi:MAG: hypothetical protein A2Z83_01330 [Omnitrophica bacterium GWA2_52_8]|nr:MAG: hypothetical protein A2Z83_01330 [Omnitrophica bacterium GWA2_52_8]